MPVRYAYGINRVRNVLLYSMGAIQGFSFMLRDLKPIELLEAGDYKDACCEELDSECTGVLVT